MNYTKPTAILRVPYSPPIDQKEGQSVEVGGARVLGDVRSLQVPSGA